jgi:hypothetical protein
MENVSGTSYANQSLRLLLSTNSSHRVSIDRRTAINLELVSNSRTGKQNCKQNITLVESCLTGDI